MLTEVFAELHAVHPALGHVAEWAFIGVLLTIALFAFSIPSHLLAQAFRDPFARAAEYIRQVAVKVRARAVLLFNAAMSRPSEFLQIARYRLVFDTQERRLNRAFSGIASATREAAKTLNRRVAEFEAGRERLSVQIEALSRVQVITAKPEVPDLTQLQTDDSVHRRAIWKLSFALVIGVALVLINSLMLHKFFEGVFRIYVFDIPLSYILALIFSLLELGIGVALYSQQQKPNTGDVRRVLAEYVLVGSIVGLCAIETFFYAVLSAGLDPDIVRPLFAPDPIPRWVFFWLAPLGTIIVVVLAFTGHALVEGWDELRHGKTAKALRAQLTRIETAGSKLVEQLDAANKHTAELLRGSKEFRKELVGGREQLPLIAHNIEENCDHLKATVSEVASHRREPYGEFSDGDSRRLFYTQVVLGAISIIVVLLFVFIQLAFAHRLGAAIGGLHFSLVVAIALVEAGAVLGAAHVLSHSVKIVLDDREPKVVAAPRSVIFGGAAGATLLSIIGFNAFLIVQNNAFVEWLWMALALACIGFIIYVGANLGLLTAAAWVAIKAFILNAGAAAAYVLSLALAGLANLFLVTASLLSAFSYPFQILCRIFGRGSTVRPAVQAAE